MSHFLKNSVFVIAGFAMTMSVAQAVPNTSKEVSPSIRFSGESSFNYYFFNQKKTEANGGKGNGQHAAIEDSRINAEVLGKTDAFGGLEYSAMIGLSGNTDSGNPLENRIKLKNELGTAIMGNSRGVDDFMACGAYSVMGGTGGFAGNFTSVLNQTTGTLITTNLGANAAPKDFTKVSYVTPRIGGLQAGVSFTPSTVHKGDHKLETINPGGAKSGPFDKNQVAAGVNFKQVLPMGLDIKLSATGLFGKTQTPRSSAQPLGRTLKYHNTNAYALGAVFGYNHFEFGAEYMDNGKSQAPRQVFNVAGTPTAVTGNDAGKAFSIALGYTMGKNKFSAGYYSSKTKMGQGFKDSKANIISLTAGHKIGQGLEVYGDLNRVDMKADDRAVAQQNNLKGSGAYVSGGNIAEGVKSNRATILATGVKMKW